MAIRSTRTIVAALLLGAAAGAHAADDAPVIRLSPEEIARIQAEAEAKPSGAAVAPDREPRRIHGEVGASIGTGGSRDVFGALNMPLGEDGQALISGGSSARDLPRRPVRRNLDRR
ncbi:MAG: hypothetical protein Q7J32_03950 [Sphingomonadaceae bacterium]|nr:hypothetical protein [Sphingomonadaceae bacterium]